VSDLRRYDFAIVGFGNVGRELARHFAERRELVRERFDVDLVLTAVVDRSGAVFAAEGVPIDGLARRKEQRGSLADSPQAHPAPRPDELRARGVEGLVVALPTNLDGGEPGLSLARAALDSGLDLVLADKGPALFALPELLEKAARGGLFLGTSATTGCALPSLSVLRSWFGAARIDEISGVLNGTSNLIVTRLREPGSTYESALAEAQRLGIAEPDPTLDVEGFDTAIKLVILARGLIDPEASLRSVARRGIVGLPAELLAAARTGPERLRLVGRARRVGTSALLSVIPELVAPTDPLHDVEGTSKAVTFRGEDLGEMTLVGGASSRSGTASALLRDLVAAARARRV